ncbi:hypothetical protein [Tenacibaculum jejuense]|uniref:Baseplate structural protein Gp10 C-terminal domain-containing protein n=1 Tax=Tenacibaculum jejuense TaxID=584609 RepID=A0A238UCI8_9FLAO|nr:hypothetical protein [Tenacibaculum jejuense]SNR16923.1 conserved protein of unknown function [Tenacibaculum jejuense]
MEINKKNRTELKQYFIAEALPTERQFSDFIEGTINQVDDGIVKRGGEPIAIASEGTTVGSQEILHLYPNFDQEEPDWSLNLNPRVDADEPETSKKGFNIKDTTGESRLFIQSGKGNIGLGTIEPTAKLTIQGAGETSLLSVIDHSKKHTQIFEVGQENGNGAITIQNGVADKNMKLRANTIEFQNLEDKTNTKSVNITAEKNNLKIKADQVQIAGNIKMDNLSGSPILKEKDSDPSDSIIPSQKAVKTYVDNRLPKGIISMWSGSVETIPEGWALCDGTNETPDLRGRFIVGFDAENPEYNQAKKTGGLSEVQLTVQELPAHTHEDSGHDHNINDPGHNHNHNRDGKNFNVLARYTGKDTTDTMDNNKGAGREFALNDYGTIQSKQTGIEILSGKANLQNTGKDQPHENRPPFFVLAYIIKL